MTQLLSKAGQAFLQKALVWNVRGHLGRDPYPGSREEDPHRGYRNPYEPKRVKTVEGEVKPQVPEAKAA